MEWYILNSSGSGLGLVGSFHEHGNKISGPIKCSEILGYVSKRWLIKKDSAQWS
jgi:hypothetical protein